MRSPTSLRERELEPDGKAWLTLVDAIEKLSAATAFDEIVDIVKTVARRVAGADGVSIILKDGHQCHYVDEDAVGPLWKGKRFPAEACISGWCMINRSTATVPDIYADSRIPVEAYRPTFVKSLVMVPVGQDEPVAAIGAYWARPLTPPPSVVAQLEVLARSTATALVSAQRYQSLRESEQRLSDLLEALPAAVYTTDALGNVTYFNQAAINLAGYRPEVPGTRWCVSWRLFNPDGTPLPHDRCPMAACLRENRPIRGTEILVERPDGYRVPVIVFPTPIRDSQGRLRGAVNMLADVSERKEAEAQQRMLINELNHRVKNNMQMLYSMVQTAQRKTKSPEAKAILTEAGQRIGAMSAVQHVLYNAKNPIAYNAVEFLEAVSGSARQAFGNEVEIVVTQAEGELSSDSAMPLALIANELLTNAVKHGINGSTRGQIRLGLVSQVSETCFYVEDDGPGFTFSRPKNNSSGLGLVAGLARQLGGHFSVESGGSTRCTVKFSLHNTLR